ncbi:MAG: peptide-methionine (S)-S-oxide reductase MsrA [Aureliella sp.]
MQRSYVRLLIRMTLGLAICAVAWSLQPGAKKADPGLAVHPAAAAAAESPAAGDEPGKASESAAATAKNRGSDAKSDKKENKPDQKEHKMEQATFGGGCFWCVEAVLQRVEGVEKVVSGYAGGKFKNPTYEQVCTGRTGHAEVVQVTYDPSKISYTKLLEIFMKTHDPTTLDRQGHDVGDQYRSIILTHNDEQARLAREMKEKLDASGIFDDPIVTKIEPLTEFYPAEEGHQNYYNQNPESRYCQVVVRSKVEKLEKFFSELMKSQYK